MTEPTDRLDRDFNRKVWLGKWSLLVERLWPRVWTVIGVVGAFVLVSLAGIWPLLGAIAHQILLGVFALALVAAIVFAARVPSPTDAEAIRRIERRSGLTHRPASAYTDTLSNPGSDPATATLWQAHRDRLARLLARLRVGAPVPRTDRHDPYAVRALLPILAALMIGIVGDSASDRLLAAFRIGPPVTAVEARLDAWVTPPAYTARPPVMLADGSRGIVALVGTDRGPAALEVPEKSLLIVRTSGQGLGGLALDITLEGGKTLRVDAAAPSTPADAAEVRHELTGPATVRVRVGRSEIAAWSFSVIRDLAPKISLVKDPEPQPRGALKLTYKVEDDYGIASAEARIERPREPRGDPATAWARTELLSGARKPYERPPQLPLRLPRDGAAGGQAQSHLELGAHPWAGLPVTMTLVAKDHAGQTGRSASIEMTLPMRRFVKPLARAVVEQRSRLVEDARYRRVVIAALEALTYEPEGFITGAGVYLGLRSVVHRLQQDTTRSGLKSAIDQLWHIALKIEDGNLSDAERRLKEAQENLAKALERGAGDEEIQRLMQELRQAMNEFLQQMMRQAEGQPPMDMPPGMDQNQTLSSDDLERMMRQLEDMARNGSRDAAQQMLSQLRDLLDRLQSGRMAQGQGQQGQGNQQAMRMLDELGNIIGGQQRLMDETFGDQGQQGEQGQGQQGRQGQQGQGQRGQQPGRPGQQGRDGQQGQGQGQQGQGQGQQGQGQRGQRPGRGELTDRQSQLGDRLGQLQRDMRGNGMRSPEQFGSAEEAMRNAERMLREGDLDGASREQGRALEQLRQGAQSMAQQMLQRSPSQFGQAGDAPRDPLGRPQRSENFDPGSNVRIPDAIDMQRAREIIEELRRRLGDQTRPSLELDYLERLLRRF